MGEMHTIRQVELEDRFFRWLFLYDSIERFRRAISLSIQRWEELDTGTDHIDDKGRDTRIFSPLQQIHKASKSKNLQTPQNAAYKPAYKKILKTVCSKLWKRFSNCLLT